MKRGLLYGLVGTLFLAAACYWAAQIYADARTRERIDAALKSLPGDIKKVEYGSVSTSLITRTATVRDISVDAGAAGMFKVGRVDVDRFDLGHKQPYYMEMRLSGVDVPTERLGRDARDILARMGHPDRFVFNVDYAYEFDDEKKTLTVKQVRVSAPDIGIFTVTVVVGGLPSLDFNDARVRALAPLMAQITGASLVYKDTGGARRALRAFAAQQNLSEDSAKARLFRDIEREQAKVKDELARDALAELKKFIDNPNEFVVTAKPEPPFRLGELLAITDFKRRLGISIAAR